MKRILIVEDDLDIAEMLNAYFRVQGYEVYTVNWGEDGVRAAQTDLPDLMILDIRLPDIDACLYVRRNQITLNHMRHRPQRATHLRRQRVLGTPW